MIYPKFNYQTAMPTPWGKADSKHLVMPGVYSVGTPSHGGIMVGKRVAKRLCSKLEWDIGIIWGNWLTFEEDCACNAFIYKHPVEWRDYWVKHNPIMVAKYPRQADPLHWQSVARESLHTWYPLQSDIEGI